MTEDILTGLDCSAPFFFFFLMPWAQAECHLMPFHWRECKHIQNSATHTKNFQDGWNTQELLNPKQNQKYLKWLLSLQWPVEVIQTWDIQAEQRSANQIRLSAKQTPWTSSLQPIKRERERESTFPVEKSYRKWVLLQTHTGTRLFLINPPPGWRFVVRT